MPKKFYIALLVLAAVAVATTLWVRSLPPTLAVADPDVPLTPAVGEKLFWGKGTCHVCHRIGERGYALRGPNLGESEYGAIIPERAKKRAKELGLAGATDYLVQSLARPGAFVVPGFNNEMPEVFKPPVMLYPSEIKAIIRYLQSLSGETKFAPIRLPNALLRSYQAQDSTAQTPVTGNAAAGRRLFFDLHGAAGCAACHAAIDSTGQAAGATWGPNLTEIASIRTAARLRQKIVTPDSNIVSGYRVVLLKLKGNRFLAGILRKETPDSLTLLLSTGAGVTVPTSMIEVRMNRTASIMPGNYADLLSPAQIDDLLAFLLTLKSPASR